MRRKIHRAIAGDKHLSESDYVRDAIFEKLRREKELAPQSGVDARSKDLVRSLALLLLVVSLVVFSQNIPLAHAGFFSTVTITLSVTPSGAGTLCAPGGQCTSATITVTNTCFFFPPVTVYASPTPNSLTVNGASSPLPNIAYLACVDGASYNVVAKYGAPPVTITVNTSPSGLDSPYGGGTYNIGSSANIGVGTPSGYTFKYWTRDGVQYASSQAFSYTVDGSHTFTALYVNAHIDYTIIVNTSPSGLDGPYGTNTYPAGTLATIGVSNANPTGYSLDHWTKNGANYAGAASYLSITVDGPHTFTAVYKQAAASCNWYISGPTIYLQAGQSGSGTVTVQKDSSSGACSAVSISASGSFSPRLSPTTGAPIYQSQLTVTVPAGTAAGTYYVTIQGTGPATTYLTYTYAYVVVQEVKPYHITVSTSPSGLDSPYGGGDFSLNAATTIGVSTPSGYAFQYWLRDGSVYTYSQSFSYTVDASHTFTAVFQQHLQYQLTVNSPYDSPWGTGLYDAGTVASFGVTSPASGSAGVQYICTGYSGSQSDTQCTGSITMNGPKTITFAWKTQYLLTIQVNPTGGGTTTPSVGSYWYDPGTSVTIIASPAGGNMWLNWAGSGTGSYSGSSVSVSVTMNGPITETANFQGHGLGGFQFVDISSPQVSGQSFPVIIYALDVLGGGRLTSYAGTNTLTASKGTITPTSITFTEGQWGGQVTITVTSAQIGVTLTTTGGGKSKTSGAFDVAMSSPADHFDFDAITSPQTAGTAFTIKITAKDSSDRTVTGYSGTNVLADTTGTINPTVTTAFSSGIWTGSVTITKAQGNITITTTSAGKTGQSNSFTVNPGPLASFAFETISDQTSGTPFTITVTAKDAYGNVLTGYTNLCSLSVSPTGTTNNPTSTGAFTNGIWTGQVTVAVTAQTQVIMTAAGGGKTGNSNPFNVTPSPIDHFVFDTIMSPQTVNKSFTVKITAVDANGDIASYASATVLTDKSGTINPGSVTFANGIWTGTVTITRTCSGDIITVSGGGKFGQSNSFDVQSELNPFDFTVTASPLSEQVGRGDSITVTVAVVLLHKPASQVTLAISGGDPTMQMTLQAASGTPSFATELVIAPGDTTPLGHYSIILSGTAGDLKRSLLLDMEVTRTPPQSFTVRTSPSGASVIQGASTSMTVIVTFRNGYSQTVTLSYPNLPSGITVTDCSKDSGDATFQATCTITTDSTVQPTGHIIQVTGTSDDGKTKNAYFLLLVSPLSELGERSPDYSVAADPSAITGVIPTTGTSTAFLTVYVQSLDGFSQQVNLSLEVPSGLTGVAGTFTSTALTPAADGRSNTTLTLKVASSTSQGTYRLTVKATSGPLSQPTTTRTADFILTLSPNPQSTGLYVEILQPTNEASVSGIFLLTANCTDLIYGPGNVNATYQISGTLGASKWAPMTPPINGSVWTVNVDTVALQLENGAYTATVKATRMNDPTASTADSITVHLDNSAIVHKNTYIINYPRATLLHGDGNTYSSAWWYEEDHFMPGETIGVRIPADTTVTISIPADLVYLGYSATLTVTPVSGYAIAVFPLVFTNSIHGQYQITIQAGTETTHLGFTIEGADADWYTMQHLDHASVVAALKWPDTDAAILHRAGTITATSTIGSNSQVSGTANDAGAIIVWTPYVDWYGQPVFAVTYTGSSVQIMHHDGTTPLAQTFTYDVLATSYTAIGQDYSETVNLQFFSRYQTGHPAVDTYVALQVSTGQPWMKAETVSGQTTIGPITIANPDGSKPLTWTIRAWTYAVKVTSPTIYANQWANLEVDHEDYTTTVTVDGLTRIDNGLNVKTSVTSGAMWLDISSVEAKIVIKNSAGQIVGQQTYAVTIEHGKVNHYTWLVSGDYAAGTYTVEVTLAYGIPEPPVNIGATTRQLAAN